MAHQAMKHKEQAEQLMLQAEKEDLAEEVLSAYEQYWLLEQSRLLLSESRTLFADGCRHMVIVCCIFRYLPGAFARASARSVGSCLANGFGSFCFGHIGECRFA
jgi:hypothetical protein